MPMYEKVFSKGENLVKNQLNLYTVIETLMKIKASIAILVGEDEKLLSKIKQLYLQNATIKLNDEGSVYINDQETEIIKFLNRNERQEIKQQMIKTEKQGFLNNFKNQLMSGVVSKNSTVAKLE